MSFIRIKCPLCDSLETAQEKKFTQHLIDAHSMTPEGIQRLYDDLYLDGQRPHCGCSCGEELRWYGWKEGYPLKFLRGHNAKVYAKPRSVKENFIKEKEKIEQQKDPTHRRVVQKEHKVPQKLIDFTPPSDPNTRGQEIIDFLVFECGINDAVLNDVEQVPGYRIDVVIPSKKLAIDCCNLYWNADVQLHNDRNYHEKKLNACIEHGYTLFMFYEDEWRDKPSLLKMMIKHRLGLSNEAYNARKLQVKRLSVAERREFFNASHLEGDTNSTAAFGLVTTEGLIVAAESIRRAFHKRYESYYEIGRAASRPGTIVRGWIGKLTKVCYEFAVEQKKHGLVTYVDSRVGPGKAYEDAGFKTVKGSTGTRLWWTDYVNKFNRFQFKADLEHGKSQRDVCEEAGVVALYGVGNKLLIMKKPGMPDPMLPGEKDD